MEHICPICGHTYNKVYRWNYQPGSWEIDYRGTSNAHLNLPSGRIWVDGDFVRTETWRCDDCEASGFTETQLRFFTADDFRTFLNPSGISHFGPNTWDNIIKVIEGVDR